MRAVRLDLNMSGKMD